jgi:hypothetical protein
MVFRIASADSPPVQNSKARAVMGETGAGDRPSPCNPENPDEKWRSDLPVQIRIARAKAPGALKRRCGVASGVATQRNVATPATVLWGCDAAPPQALCPVSRHDAVERDEPN